MIYKLLNIKSDKNIPQKTTSVFRVMRKGKVIAVAGKGGSGKNSYCRSLNKGTIERSKNDSILVVDADPDSNLPEALGSIIKPLEMYGKGC